jgi:hypothetical protein
MNADALLRRLRAARPPAPVPGDHEELFARIVAEPGDPRLAESPPRFEGRLRRRVLAGSTLGLAGAVAVFVLALGGSAAPPAFAITRSGGGAVLVRISQLESLPDANRRLTAMGLHEQVTLYMAAGPARVRGPVTCTPKPGTRPSGPPLKVLVVAEGAYHLDSCLITG